MVAARIHYLHEPSPEYDAAPPASDSPFTRMSSTIVDELGQRVGPSAAWVYAILSLHADNTTGECHPSIDTIADKAGMSNRQALRALQSLEDAGYITRTRRATSRGMSVSSLYTIVHHPKPRTYGGDKPHDIPGDIPGDKPHDIPGVENGAQTIEDYTELERTIPIPAGLQRVWDVYPEHRRPGTPQSLVSAWNRIRPRGDDVGRMIQSVEAWKQSPKWRESDGQFVPGLNKFLQERRWEQPAPVDPLAGMNEVQRMFAEQGL